jgi:hypothetical protein
MMNSILYTAHVPVFIPEGAIDGKPVCTIVPEKLDLFIKTCEETDAPLAFTYTMKDRFSVTVESGDFRCGQGVFYHSTHIPVTSKTLSSPMIGFGAFIPILDRIEEKAKASPLPLYPAGILDALRGVSGVSQKVREHWNSSFEADLSNDELVRYSYNARREFQAACSDIVIINGKFWTRCEAPIIGVRNGHIKVFATSPSEALDVPAAQGSSGEWTYFPASEFNEATRLAWRQVAKSEAARLETVALDVYACGNGATADDRVFPVKADLPALIHPQSIRAVVADLMEGPNRRRLAAIAALYEGARGGDVANEHGVSAPTLRAWVEVFNSVDQFAFLPAKPNSLEVSLRGLACRKLVSPISFARKIDAVSLSLQGASAVKVFEATGIDKAHLKSLLTTYHLSSIKALSPNTTLPASLLEPKARAAREIRLATPKSTKRKSKSVKVDDFDPRILKFVGSNNVARLRGAAKRALGPIEAALFESLATRASGLIVGARHRAISSSEFETAISEFQEGGIEGVTTWFRGAGLEVPWPFEIRKLAVAQRNHPAQGRLMSIAAFLEGKSASEAADMNWMAERGFLETFGNYKRFGEESHRVFGIMGPGRGYSVPDKPKPLAKGRKGDLGFFRDRQTAGNYIAQVFRIKVELRLERLVFLRKYASCGAQRSRLDSLIKLSTAASIDAVDKMGKSKALRETVRSFATLGPAGLLEDQTVLDRYKLPDQDLAAARTMAASPEYDHRRQAAAVVDIAQGMYPLEASHAHKVSLEDIELMVSNFSFYCTPAAAQPGP